MHCMISTDSGILASFACRWNISRAREHQGMQTYNTYNYPLMASVNQLCRELGEAELLQMYLLHRAPRQCLALT
jgi:hypothetical protein